MFRRLAMACAAVSTLALATPALAQQRPADLSTLPPVPTDYTPDRLPWGDYDFTGTWPIEPINNGHILFQRPEQYGDRYWVTDEEFERRLAAARGNDGNFAEATESGIGTAGTEGLAEWFENTDWAKSTAMLVSPADGQLPPLTPQAMACGVLALAAQVLKRKWITSPSWTTYSLPSSRALPASLAGTSPPSVM